MGEQTTRLWVAVLLTGMDIAVFKHFFVVIWLVSSGIAWIRTAFFLLLAVWTASAAVLWLHVSYDLRGLLYERRRALALTRSQRPKELRGKGDV
jgi:hypothetical protein